MGRKDKKGTGAVPRGPNGQFKRDDHASKSTTSSPSIADVPTGQKGKEGVTASATHTPTKEPEAPPVSKAKAAANPESSNMSEEQTTKKAKAEAKNNKGTSKAAKEKEVSAPTNLDIEQEEVVALEGDVLSDGDADYQAEFPPLPPSAGGKPAVLAAQSDNGNIERDDKEKGTENTAKDKTDANSKDSHRAMGTDDAARIKGPERNAIAQKTNVWTAGSKKIFMNHGIGGKLQYTKPTSPRATIKISEGLPTHSVWGWSLLGQYVGYPPGHLLLNTLMKTWGVKSKYRIEEGWYFFQFESEEDKDKVLKGGPYLINGRPLLVKNIPNKFAFNRRDIATVPLWVRVFGLPRNYWTPDILGRLASHVGTPLFTDPVTEGRRKGSYARCLVEINFAATIVREIPVMFDDGEEIRCSILIENEPKYCVTCCSFGHEPETCSFKDKKEPIGPKSKKAVGATKEGVLKGTNQGTGGVDAGLERKNQDSKEVQTAAQLSTETQAKQGKADEHAPQPSLDTGKEAAAGQKKPPKTNKHAGGGETKGIETTTQKAVEVETKLTVDKPKSRGKKKNKHKSTSTHAPTAHGKDADTTTLDTNEGVADLPNPLVSSKQDGAESDSHEDPVSDTDSGDDGRDNINYEASDSDNVSSSGQTSNREPSLLQDASMEENEDTEGGEWTPVLSKSKVKQMGKEKHDNDMKQRTPPVVLGLKAARWPAKSKTATKGTKDGGGRGKPKPST